MGEVQFVEGSANAAAPLPGVAERAAGAAAPRARPLKVCLAASGGGHVRQLLDLEPVWSQHDYFFITEDTALSRSIAKTHPVRFVSHVALGQSRLGKPLRMAVAGVRNFFESASAIIRTRPDVLISTGAGSAFFAVFWARLLGAKTVVVESFARFDHPSAFGRIAGGFAHHKVVQSAALSAFWPDAAVFDPLKLLDGPRPEKQPLLFATVGATLPFDRLVQMVADAKAQGQITEEVLIQTGVGGAAPAGLQSHETMSFEDIQAVLSKADIVVCHGGTGSLITALRHGCRVIAVPRLFERGEHYDDHQAEITSAFANRGLISVANTPEEFAAALGAVRQRQPVLATTDPVGLINHLNGLIAQWKT
jgi:UDP-N-acetylglucosamine transferase subunit ALG13